MTLRTIKQNLKRCGKKTGTLLVFFLSNLVISVAKFGRTTLTEEVSDERLGKTGN